MDFGALQKDGFIHLSVLIGSDLLDEFETTVAALGEACLEHKGMTKRSADALCDALKVGGDYRVRLFNNLKNLYVINRMCGRVALRLEEEGFFNWANLTAPLLYPSFRADLPGEDTYLLPMHQDHATQCRRAWRFWIPLRDANPDSGTMRIVPTSHRLGILKHDVSDPKLPYVPQSEYAELDTVTLEVPAGDGVLFDPLLVHGSVAAQAERIKYVLLIQVQDLATVADPDDPEDLLPARLAMTAERDQARDIAIVREKK